MNSLTFADFRERLTHRVRTVIRRLDPVRRAPVFSKSSEPDALSRIYVVNLDRKSDRWNRIHRELDRFRERRGQRLSALTRRFSAIDARYLVNEPDSSLLSTDFTLAEQLAVHPNPSLEINDGTRTLQITMTRQEQAVALSHIAVWRLIADGDVPSALVLEDDVVLMPGFANGLCSTWSQLVDADGTYGFDLLYLAYRDVGALKSGRNSHLQRRVAPGLWEAAGYVLTRDGARALLANLPVRGPVDLWLNMQFATLRVYTSKRPLIEQRIDEPSTNSYSVLPVLSQVGAVTREKPLLPTAQKLPDPVIAVGTQGLGLTALATALSMLGYTCISDVDQAPLDELTALTRGQKVTTFNAFVNVGSIDEMTLSLIASRNPRALFITTDSDDGAFDLPVQRTLRLPPDTDDKWAELCDFLKLDYPPFLFPRDEDLHQRKTSAGTEDITEHVSTDLKSDRSPWILRGLRERHRIQLDDSVRGIASTSLVQWSNEEAIDNQVWKIRDDTFPSNLAIFTAKNLIEKHGQPMTLMLRKESTPVREFTSAAIASQQQFLYGSFAAELQPSNVSGVITGLFLHRNGPRQEIDIEFLGRDTTKMLVNVYYNPGPTGTKLEYGYRGTPTQIELGFDAAEAVHLYEIEWSPGYIAWKVDGKTVYRRHVWDPTPIPDQPLEFNINLWNSRSVEFAGHIDVAKLPATAQVQSIRIDATDSPLVNDGGASARSNKS